MFLQTKRPVLRQVVWRTTAFFCQRHDCVWCENGRLCRVSDFSLVSCLVRFVIASSVDTTNKQNRWFWIVHNVVAALCIVAVRSQTVCIASRKCIGDARVRGRNENYFRSQTVDAADARQHHDAPQQRLVEEVNASVDVARVRGCRSLLA